MQKRLAVEIYYELSGDIYRLIIGKKDYEKSIHLSKIPQIDRNVEIILTVSWPGTKKQWIEAIGKVFAKNLRGDSLLNYSNKRQCA